MITNIKNSRRVVPFFAANLSSYLNKLCSWNIHDLFLIFAFCNRARGQEWRQDWTSCIYLLNVTLLAVVKFVCMWMFMWVGMCVHLSVCVCVCVSGVRRDATSVTHGWPLDLQLKRWPVMQSYFNLPWELMGCILTLNLFLYLYLSRNYTHTCILPHYCVCEQHVCAPKHAQTYSPITVNRYEFTNMFRSVHLLPFPVALLWVFLKHELQTFVVGLWSYSKSVNLPKIWVCEGRQAHMRTQKYCWKWLVIHQYSNCSQIKRGFTIGGIQKILPMNATEIQDTCSIRPICLLKVVINPKCLKVKRQ